MEDDQTPRMRGSLFTDLAGFMLKLGYAVPRRMKAKLSEKVGAEEPD